MHVDYGYSEEDVLARKGNFRLLAKLLPHLRPYKKIVAVVLVLTLLGTGFDLIFPYLSKVAIDRYILPFSYRVNASAPVPREVQRRVSAYGSLFQGRRFLSKEEIRRIDPADLHLFQENGIVGEKRYYRCAWRPSLEPLVSKHRADLERVGGSLYIEYERLLRLPPGEIRMLRAEDMWGVVRIALLFLALLGFSFALYYGSIYCLEWLSQHIMQDIRLRLFRHLLHQRIGFFDRNLTGKLVTRVTNDVQNLNELFKSVIVAVFKDAFVLIGVMAVMLRMDVSLALVCFTLIPFVLLLTGVFARLSRAAFREIRARVAQLNAFLQETFNNMAVIQYFAVSAYRLEGFRRINRRNFSAGMKQIGVFAVFLPAIEAVSSIAVGFLLWHGGGKVLRSEISLGVLVAFIGYIQLFFRPIRELSEKFNIMQSALASTERIFDLLEREPRMPRREVVFRPGKVAGHIVFEDVRFSYRKGEPVLQGVSFEVRPGETLALVGPTGAGKTTVIHLLERFYEPDSGRITVDGVDIREWDLGSLRSAIGLVMQDVTLFSGTVLENILMGRDGYTRDAVHARLHSIRADRFIDALPRGYDHEIGEAGEILSAGERQLLAFARVLMYDPRILVLDEATANVDPETEQRIQDALRILMKGRTTLVIAHRLSTVRNADRILVLQQGRVEESGTHEELIARKGLYYDLHRYQEQM